MTDKSATDTIESLLSDGDSIYEDITQFDDGYTPPVTSTEEMEGEDTVVEQEAEPFYFSTPKKQNMVYSDGDIFAYMLFKPVYNISDSKVYYDKFL